MDDSDLERMHAELLDYDPDERQAGTTGYRLTDWEADFIETLASDRHILSRSQAAKLQEIYERVFSG
jgi:hypothetical protein